MVQLRIISTLIGTMAICASLMAAEVNPQNVIADGSVDAPNQKLVRQMGATILAGYCDAVFPLPPDSTSVKGDPSKETPDNAALHRCQYIRESPDCIGNSTCPSYEDWTKTNAEISPSLPRASFLDALDKHQKRLQATQATN